MPKAKRAKIESLTKVSKKTKGAKDKLLARLTTRATRYASFFLLSIENLNTEVQNQLRRDMKGEFSFGKKTILIKFIKDTVKDEEQQQKMMELIKNNKNQTAILFSNEKPEKVQKVMKELEITVFAQPGTEPLATVELQSGREVFDSVSNSNAHYLRTLGVLVTVQKGKLNLEEKVLAAQKGEKLTVNQCKLLRVLGVKLGKSEANLVCYYNLKTEEFQVYQ